MKEGARLSDSGTRNVFSVHESVLFSYITVMLGAHSYPRGSAPWTPATARGAFLFHLRCAFSTAWCLLFHLRWAFSTREVSFEVSR